VEIHGFAGGKGEQIADQGQEQIKAFLQAIDDVALLRGQLPDDVPREQAQQALRPRDRGAQLVGDDAHELGALVVGALQGVMGQGVLDGDRALLGDGRDEVGVLPVEAVFLAAVDAQDAQRPPPADDRHGQQTLDALGGHLRRVLHARIVLRIVDDHGLAAECLAVKLAGGERHRPFFQVDAAQAAGGRHLQALTARIQQADRCPGGGERQRRVGGQPLQRLAQLQRGVDVFRRLEEGADLAFADAQALDDRGGDVSRGEKPDRQEEDLRHGVHGVGA